MRPVERRYGHPGCAAGPRKDRKGQFIDISEVESGRPPTPASTCLTFLYRGHHRHPPGHSRPQVYPCEIFPCKDGYVSLIAPQIEQWLRFVEVLARQAGPKSPATATAAPCRRLSGRGHALIIPLDDGAHQGRNHEALPGQTGARVPIYDIARLSTTVRLKPWISSSNSTIRKPANSKYAKGPCTFERPIGSWQTSAPLLGQDNEKVYW